MASNTHESRLKITLLDQVSSRARGIASALGGIERQASSFGAPFRSMVGQAIAFGGAYLGVSEGLKATAGSAISFESAFADVRKVVDANEEQFDNMRRTIRKMSTELPIAANDIAAIFAAAGESGVATADLKAFSEMAARVGIAFDMSAGEAGESLAKLKTQLGLSVAETGDMADAINQLSNSMASKAKDITSYMLRVGALAEMGGFTKEQIAGIGSAMIAAGAEAETAGTAMQNVVKALTKGQSAKKSQREVAAALGLNLPEIAKEMQKDAPKALRKVLTAIGKAPKDRHIALLSDFFGDEAKAFAPLIGNMGLLEQALDSVSDKTKYSGSAFREYVERSKTTANALQLLGNKVSNIFWAKGDEMLPTIRQAAAGIGEVLDTLDSRVSVFDRLETGIKGFAQGLGYGGVREVIDDLGDLLFGKIDATAGDQLGRIFMQAKDWGATIRELNAAIAENPIAKFLGEIAPYGLQIVGWSIGIGLLAGTVRKLAGALMLLSGASTILATLKSVGSLASILGGGEAVVPGKPAGSGGKPAVGGKSAPAVAGNAPAAGSWKAIMLGLGRLSLGVSAAAGAYELANQTATGDTAYKRGQSLLPGVEDVTAWLWKNLSQAAAASPNPVSETYKKDSDQARAEQRRFNVFGAYEDRIAPKPEAQKPLQLENLLPQIDYKPIMPRFMKGGAGSKSAAVLDQPMRLDSASIDAMTQPRGTQDVNVTNPRPAPNVSLSLTFHAHGVTNPEELANQVSSRVGQQLREQVAGIYADTDYGVA